MNAVSGRWVLDPNALSDYSLLSPDNFRPKLAANFCGQKKNRIRLPGGERKPNAVGGPISSAGCCVVINHLY